MAPTRSKGHRQEPQDKISEIDISWMEEIDIRHISEPGEIVPGSFTITDLAEKTGKCRNTVRDRVRVGLELGRIERIEDRVIIASNGRRFPIPAYIEVK